MESLAFEGKAGSDTSIRRAGVGGKVDTSTEIWTLVGKSIFHFIFQNSPLVFSEFQMANLAGAIRRLRSSG